METPDNQPNTEAQELSETLDLSIGGRTADKVYEMSEKLGFQNPAGYIMCCLALSQMLQDITESGKTIVICQDGKPEGALNLKDLYDYYAKPDDQAGQ